jgi:hypothetical protein
MDGTDAGVRADAEGAVDPDGKNEGLGVGRALEDVASLGGAGMNFGDIKRIDARIRIDVQFRVDARIRIDVQSPDPAEKGQAFRFAHSPGLAAGQEWAAGGTTVSDRT